MADRRTRSLIDRCRRGDRAAWDEFLDEYGRLVWSVAHRLGASGEEAQEVFQRTWVALVEGIDRIRDPDRVVAWIAATTRHHTWRLFDEQKRHRRAQSLDQDHEERPDDTPGTDDCLAEREMAGLVHHALDALDPRCRRLLTLLFLTEPTPDYQRISDETGLAVGSIGPIRARCLKKLRTELHRLYQPPSNDDT
jgi:RNA polymerase sigma factor (sigma-70 family)